MAEIKAHDINQVMMYVSNFGKFAQTMQQEPGCLWPINTCTPYIFGAGVWFGTVDSVTGDTLVSIGYGPHGAETEYVSGLSGMTWNHPCAVLYMYPDLWPPPHDTFCIAPQVAVSDQDSWCCFNDCNSCVHMPGDTRPIGIEVYQTVYAWDESFIDDVIFLTYEVKNVSGRFLRNCYIGICIDDCVHNARHALLLDSLYCINSNVYFIDDFVFSHMNDDTSSSQGAVGVDLLQTPFDLQPGQDKDGDGIQDQFERDSSYYWN